MDRAVLMGVAVFGVLAGPLASAPSQCALRHEDRLLASDGVAFDAYGSAVDADRGVVIVGAPGHDGAGTDAGAIYFLRRISGTWQESERVAASDARAGDAFGSAVALSGELALVGAPGADSAGPDSGAAYLYRWTGSDWSEESKLTGSGFSGGEEFGQTVALGADVLVIGAPGALDRGAAFVFGQDPSGWSLREVLSAPDADPGDGFGAAVALDEGTVLVGAPGDDERRLDAGAAYVFRFDGASFNLNQKLVARAPEVGTRLGHDVALHGDVAALANAPTTYYVPGGALVFRFGGARWAEEQMLVCESRALGKSFVVDVRGDLALLGNPLSSRGLDGLRRGAAWLFNAGDGAWGLRQELAPEPAFEDGQFGTAVALAADGAWIGALGNDLAEGAGSLDRYELDCGPCLLRSEVDTHTPAEMDLHDGFGLRMDSDGSAVAVSAPFHDAGGDARGAVWMLRRVGDEIEFEQVVENPTGQDQTYFGLELAVDGELLVVAHSREVQGGAAHVYRFDGARWNLEQTLAGPTPFFGWSVEVEGEEIFVGHPAADDSAGEAGVVYVYGHDGTSWVERQRLHSADARAGDRFGETLAASPEVLLVGAPHDDDGVLNSGVVHVFRRASTGWIFEAKLRSSAPVQWYEFGRELAVQGGRAAVHELLGPFGERYGAVHVFEWNGVDWVHRAALEPEEGRQRGSRFGQGLAFGEDFLAVGAPGGTHGAIGSGAVYLYREVRGQWTQETRLITEQPGGSESLGTGVAALGGEVLAGSPGGGPEDRGALYWFDAAALSLQVTPAVVREGDTLGLRLCDGLAGSIGLIAAVEFSGVPTFIPVAVVRFDAAGEYALDARVPPGLVGIRARFQGFGLERYAEAVATGRRAVLLR